MRAGALRHQIEIESYTEVQNGYGEPKKTWIPFAAVWARVRPLVGKEYFSAQQTQASVSHEISIRYLAGIDPSMRVSFESRIFNIQSVLNVHERDRELLLMCSEHV